MVQHTANKINETYFAYALDHLVIDQIGEHVFADVPSERDSDKTYRVDIDESDPRHVHAVKCHCPSTVPCKHVQIVNAFFYRILRHYEQPIQTVDIQTEANRVAYDATLDQAYEALGVEMQARKVQQESIETSLFQRGLLK